MTFAETLGIEALEVGPQRVRLRLTVPAGGTNMYGSAHGGLLFSLADEAFAQISNQGVQAVGIETHMSFFRAAQPGDTLTATATPERVGRTLATYRVQIEGGGEVVALFHGTVSRRERPATP